MSEREVTKPTIERKAREPRREWNLSPRPPISISDMTGEILTIRKMDSGKHIYAEIAQTPFHVFSAVNGSGDQEFVAVGPTLPASRVNALLYFAAPNKIFGFDTQDIINDWTDLYEKDMHKKRREAHARMPGWAQFEESKDGILGVLDRNFKPGISDSGELSAFKDEDRTDGIVPVLRWKQTDDGKQHIILDPMDETLREAIAQAVPEDVAMDRLDAGMGLMYLAAYSPDQSDWGEESGYKSEGDGQAMGPTQVLALAYREVVSEQKDAVGKRDPRQNLQTSPLLAGFSSYAATGETPFVPTVGIPVADYETLPGIYSRTVSDVKVDDIQLQNLTPLFPDELSQALLQSNLNNEPPLEQANYAAKFFADSETNDLLDLDAIYGNDPPQVNSVEDIKYKVNKSFTTIHEKYIMQEPVVDNTFQTIGAMEEQGNNEGIIIFGGKGKEKSK